MYESFINFYSNDANDDDYKPPLMTNSGTQTDETMPSEPSEPPQNKSKIHFYSNDANDDDYEPTMIDSGTQTDEMMPGPSEPPQTKSKRGRPKKNFEDCGASSKRAKLDDLLTFLQKIAGKMGTHFEHLLYYLGRRHSYKNGKFDEAKFYEDLLEHGIDTEFTKITPEKAMYLR